MPQGFVFSPSNMDAYRKCPRRFQGQSITKEIKWKSTGQKSRGSVVHRDVQKAIREGAQAVTTWDEGLSTMYVQQQIHETRELIAGGDKVLIEHEMTVNRKLRPTTWWGDDAFLRAKADHIVIPQNKALPIDIVDIKTGKKWDNDAFQLRVECLLAHLIYQRPVINYAYWCVDIGDTEDGTIDFANGLAPVQDIIKLMRDMGQSLQDNQFLPTRNNFCKWCDFNQTPKCGL